MTKEDRCRRALALHEGTLNCAQCMMVAFSDVLDLSEETCAALGGGLGRGGGYGGMCGTVNTALMVLGARCPHTAEHDMEGRRRLARLTREFRRRYQERFGALDCRELLATKELRGTEMVEKLGVADHCGILIVSAVEMLSDMLDELDKE
ncbi:MAG: C_GCAxxG_C_C family protein [Ruminococcaceae bacterium]|jgi:C_GCAxxG_C_C family probable redox protein|nr:C_GCAxxG_C_C family protein [Oscillospiraceae bacterium]